MPDSLTGMCFCKIEKPDHDEEVVVPNRPRRQAPQRLSHSSRLGSGQNVSSVPARVDTMETLGAVQPYSCPRTVELRRSVSQDRFVLVETITPRSSGHIVRQRPSSFGAGLQPARPI